jgi:hypothetical protein
MQLRQYSLGLSKEFMKSLLPNYKPGTLFGGNAFLAETQLLASCTYENGTKWGKEASAIYVFIIER